MFPDIDRENGLLEGVCGTIVEEAFEEAIDGHPLLLTDDGDLTRAKESVSIPAEVAAVWPPGQAAALLDEKRRPALCQHIKAADCKILLRWGVVEEIDKQRLLAALQSRHLPKPKTWRNLLNLWAYIAPELTGYWSTYISTRDVRIMPVQGKNILYAAEEVVRLGEKKLLKSEDDWEFLAAHLIVLNQNWPRFLAEERRIAADQKDVAARQTVDAAYVILEKKNLEDASDIDKVIDRVASEVLCPEKHQSAGMRPACADCGEAWRHCGGLLPLRIERHASPLDRGKCLIR